MNDPALFIVQGGTGRIRIFGVPDYEFADVTLDRKGGLSCSMVKVVPVRNSAQGTSSAQHSVDPQVWYEVEGRDVMEHWWASIPMPIASFLEEYDFSGKTIIPFCIHGGGCFRQSLTAITKLVPDAVLGEGLAISYSGGPSLADDVAEWLTENDISIN